jgi:hypothetical protein
MTHFALIDEESFVVQVFRGRQEDDGLESELTARTGDTYKQTSYNTWGGIHYDPATGEPSEDQSKALRFNYAGIGYIYDEHRDAFIPPKPFDSWVLDESTCLWSPPISMPIDDNLYVWNEKTQSWDMVTE